MQIGEPTAESIPISALIVWGLRGPTTVAVHLTLPMRLLRSAAELFLCYALPPASTSAVAAMRRRFFLLVAGLSLTGCLGCGSSESIFRDYECFWCKGAGTIRCTACFGQGVTRSFESVTKSGPARSCDTCGGSGNMACSCCKGTGKLSNNPLQQ
jgi:hypothetical protein